MCITTASWISSEAVFMRSGAPHTGQLGDVPQIRLRNVYLGSTSSPTLQLIQASVSLQLVTLKPGTELKELITCFYFAFNLRANLERMGHHVCLHVIRKDEGWVIRAVQAHVYLRWVVKWTMATDNALASVYRHDKRVAKSNLRSNIKV